jgi:hypothetical protein
MIIDDKLFEKILYVSFLDSLAACVYPGKGNRDRFVSMLKRFSHWPDGERISLLYLARFTNISSDPSLENARNFVIPHMEKWKSMGCGIIRINEDPKRDDPDFKKVVWKKDESSGINLTVEHFMHYNLLYQLRNSLVHQFQSGSDELKAGKCPYYQLLQTPDNNKHAPLKVELVYTSSFLADLSERTLSNIVEYFKVGNINPFPYYYAGDYWISDLN